MGDLTLGSVLAIFVALAIGSFSKGATGLGLPFIAMPLLAQMFGVERAVATLVIPGFISNGWLIWTHRAQAAETLKPMRIFLAAGLFGAVAGSWVLSHADPRVMKFALAAALGGYLIFFLLNPHYRLSERFNAALSPVLGVAAGAVQGSTGVSAPLIAPYVHALRPSKNGYVLGVATAFTLFGLSQIVSLIYFGVLTGPRLVEGLIALIPVMIFLQLGIGFAHRVDKRLFERIIIGVFVLLEAKLIYDGFAGV